MKKMSYGFLSSILIVLVLSGCSVKNILAPEAKSVRIYDALPNESVCEYIDEIVGSEANMLTFMFISNRDITIGARNDLKNQAAEMGGDTVVIQRSVFVYTTSTTFVGQVYDCSR